MKSPTPVMSTLALSIAMAFAMGGAHAQEAKKEEAKAEEKLEQVTVTARRRAELLKDVPTAITALSSERLADLNIQNVGDLAGQVPDLTVYAARGNNQTITTFIRGVGQADPVWGADPGVGLYLDDVYIARPQGGLLDVFDVQRIEVLRGPQGTLYGKNTIGGALKYVSRPLTTKTEGMVQADLGTHSQKNAKASFGTADASGEWRMRVAGASLHRAGFGKELNSNSDVSDQNTNAARVAVGYFPTNVPFTAQLSADSTRDNSHMRGFRRLAGNAFDTTKQPVYDDNYDIRSGMNNRNFTHSNGVAGNFTYTVDDAWMLKAIVSRRKSDTETGIDFDGTTSKIADVYADYHDKQNTQEIQAVYTGKDSSGVIGLYHFDGQAGGNIFNNFLNLQFARTASTVFTKSLAVYADWSFNLGKGISLNPGLRWTDEEKHAVVNNIAYKDATFSSVLAPTAVFDRKLSTSKLSPKLAINMAATAETNVYASVARGFKSGGFNIRANTAAVPDSAKPYLDEEVTTYEIGTKSDFDGGRFQLNASVFSSNYRNVQLSVFTSYTMANGSTGFFGDFTNAGKASISGVELEAVWKPTKAWRISGHLSSLEAKYDEYMDRGVNVAKNKWFSNAPEIQAGANVEYNTPVSFGGTLKARAGWKFQSKVYPTTDLSEAIAQEPYSLINAGVIWEKDKNWTVSVQGSNLTNRSYRTDGYNIPSLGILTGYYGPPRMVTASVTYKW